jgi:hypothetical protein
VTNPEPESTSTEPAPPAARLVRRVAIGYDMEAHGLPPYVIRCTGVLRRKLERAQFKVHVAMRPLSGLPADVDVVIAPEEHLEAVRQVLPEAVALPLMPEASYQPAFDELLKELAGGQALRAERLEPEDKQSPKRRIVRYRGSERLD